MKNLTIATFVYVSTFEKLLGQQTPAARRSREGVIDQLLAAAFEALEASVSVHREVDADLIDATYSAGTEMGQLMMMTGQDGFGRGDLPEDIAADMLAVAREYRQGGRLTSKSMKFFQSAGKSRARSGNTCRRTGSKP